jgi:hypothetical protein
MCNIKHVDKFFNPVDDIRLLIVCGDFDARS